MWAQEIEEIEVIEVIEEIEEIDLRPLTFDLRLKLKKIYGKRMEEY